MNWLLLQALLLSTTTVGCAHGSALSGNKSEAARRLEISRTRLQRLLDNPDFPRDSGDEP